MFFDIAVKMINFYSKQTSPSVVPALWNMGRDSTGGIQVFVSVPLGRHTGCPREPALDLIGGGHDGHFLGLTAADVNQPSNETLSQKHPPYNGGHAFVSSKGSTPTSSSPASRGG